LRFKNSFIDFMLHVFLLYNKQKLKKFKKMNTNEILQKIKRNEIDINNQTNFVSLVVKALMHKLNHSISIRNKFIPHIILNTGDDIMYLESKGYLYDVSETTNESYIYNSVPRCIVEIGSIEVLIDQLTNPYVRGMFELDLDESLYNFSAEFRRVPLKISVSLNYYFDSFLDALEASQYIITNLLTLQNFDVSYLGQTIVSSFIVPQNHSIEKQIQFDALTTESKLKSLSVDLDIETNLPVFDNSTVMSADRVIKSTDLVLTVQI
jgi:hypothetical protein